MSDTLLESLRAATLLVIILHLCWASVRRGLLSQRGWRIVLGGFLLLLFGCLLDITDNFDSLNRFVVVGDTQTKAYLEEIVGFLGGFSLIALGLLLWVPTIASIDELRDLNMSLSQRTLELKTARAEAEEANRAKSQFLANMSHEIRTPLNGILGFTKLLTQKADEGREEVRREYLEMIRKSGNYLILLINDILDLSKIEAGQLQAECRPCSPNEIIADVTSILRVAAEEKGLSLEAVCTGGILARVETDPALFRQLITNLVGNAVKYTDTGTVSVESRIDDWQTRPRLVVEVTDTGVGIAPEKLDMIFDPFVQGDNSTTRQFGGTGLGLAICRHIVGILGGGLSVQSEVGKGSTFSVELDAGPLADVEEVEDPAVLDIIYRPSRQDTRMAVPLNGRILVVEDGTTNRKLFDVILRRAGAEVVTAENGRIGAELALEQPFDLILMDMQMPVMDGYTATRRIREAGLTIPIIALTAHAMKGDERKCIAAGCSRYVTKPVDPDVLLRAIDEALEQSNPQRPETRSEPSCPDANGSTLSSTLPTDDPDFREIVEEFVERLKEQVEAMKLAWGAQDLDQLAQLAHWLKGAGGTAGFPVFTEPAKQLEAAIKEERSDGIEAAISEVADWTGRIVIAPIQPDFTVG